jgi:predicted Zn-dependent peptidase
VTLSNGLRVVLAPDRSAPVVGIAVLYDVGIRSEPEGRTGFAHLFEHLMFQGSANLEKLEHFRYVQSSGGMFNGSTHFDYTNYFEALPSNALERGLFLEADRMLSPRITEENLANQIAVVKEEIRVNVLNRPYGGFPWLTLPPVLFETFPNAHNGTAASRTSRAATVENAQDFFARYYAPGNAVLAVGGDFDPTRPWPWCTGTSDDVPRRTVPERPDFDEPAPTSERRAEQVDPLAPAPAIALGWRVPTPPTSTPTSRVVLPRCCPPATPPAAPPRQRGPDRHRHRCTRVPDGERFRRAQPHGAADRGAPRAQRQGQPSRQGHRRGARPGGDRRRAGR